MTVRQLIARLEKVENKDRIVILQKDGEGNDFSPLSGMGTAAYRAETTWYGEIGMEAEALDADLRAKGFSDADVLEGGVPAFVLRPVA